MIGQRRLRRAHTAHGFFILFGDGRHPRLFLRRELVFTEYKIKQNAEHRQRENRDDPRDLIRGVAVAADEIDDNNGGEHEANAVKEREMLIEPGDGEKDGGKLQRDERAGKYRAGKNNFEKILHGSLRKTKYFLPPSYRKDTENSTTDAPVCLM